VSFSSGKRTNLDVQSLYDLRTHFGDQNLAVDAKNLALYAVKVMRVDWIRLITEHLLLTLELNMDELNKIKACVRVRFSITRTHEIELHDLNRDELTDSLSTMTAEDIEELSVQSILTNLSQVSTQVLNHE
jgi:hypothetical protein